MNHLMFDVEANSINLDQNTPRGLRIIEEEEDSPEERPEMSANEKKELARKKRFGKVNQTFFNNEEMSNANDVILPGSGYATTQEQDEQTVEIRNLSKEDLAILKNSLLLNRFDKKDMLSPRVQEAVMKWFREGPTVIQKYVAPLILKTQKHILARAKTGSGKSAAFIVPLIELIHREKMKDPEARKRVNATAPYAIIFEPTRELCVQLAKEVRRLAEGTDVKVAFSFGTIDMATTYRLARMGSDILVGTPSRIHHMFFGIEANEIHKECFDFTNLKYLVLDEGDRLVDQSEFFTYMHAATDSDDGHGREMFLDDPVEIIVGGDEAPVKNIVQTFVEYDPTSSNIVQYKQGFVDCPITKMDYLVFLLNRFVTHKDERGKTARSNNNRSKRSSDSVAIWLIRQGFCATALNSDRDMKTRLQAVRGVQSGRYDVIVATDVLARGINIARCEDSSIVFMNNPTNYIHRIGRSGRLGNAGRVISFFNTATNSNMAPYLEMWLQKCNQQVPDFLSKVSVSMTNKIEKKLLNATNTQDISIIPAQRSSLLDKDIEF
ncbi:RNA helicase [Aphelenchoides bicaudatus]|nr:RNA helicase [Aphelenchoides bicaudatus]